MSEILARLRESGWSVAVHNDYRLNGQSRTFWLLTHSSGVWAKGEGTTDEEALASAEVQAECRIQQLARLPEDGGVVERTFTGMQVHILAANLSWFLSNGATYDPHTISIDDGDTSFPLSALAVPGMCPGTRKHSTIGAMYRNEEDPLIHYEMGNLPGVPACHMRRRDDAITHRVDGVTCPRCRVVVVAARPPAEGAG